MSETKVNNWNITGTSEQQRIVSKGLIKIKFPFERLSLPNRAELGWQDLNSKAAIENRKGSEVDTHEGLFEGRQYVLGVFYPSMASIYLDEKLINYPEISAELRQISAAQYREMSGTIL